MNMSIDKKKYSSALLQNWPRDEQPRIKPAPQPQQLQPQQQQQQQQQLGSNKLDVLYYSRGVRNDASLVPPIRQTASIFKQPVTIYRTQEGKVKDIKHGNQEKPKQVRASLESTEDSHRRKSRKINIGQIRRTEIGQLFWEKRLEGLRACDADGYEFSAMDLPKSLRPVGPYITEETLLQSVATALHVSTQPVTGQTGSKSSLETDPGVFLNPEQPLVQAVTITDDDIKRQEERVAVARKKLQEALRTLYA